MPTVPSPFGVYQHSSSVEKVIKAALRKIGALGVGDPLEAAVISECMEEFNRMVDAWNAEDLFVYAIERLAWTLVVGTQDYEIGPGANLDTARPTSILQGMAFLEDTTQTPAVEEELTIYDNAAEWGRETQKNTTATRPHSLYYKSSFPLGVVSLFPKSDKAYNLVLYLPVQLSQVTKSVENILLPPAYADALTYNLALRLAPEFGRSAPPEVVAQALETKAVLKAKNMRPAVMRCDPAVDGTGRFDIYSGEFR